jgi:hypothetical protein
MAATELTFLNIINRVLRRLRETEVATYNETEFSTLIGDVVNTVKSEMEEAWYWNSLRDTYSVAASYPSASYALTGTSSEGIVMDAWNRTYGNEIKRGTSAGFNRKYFGTPVGQSVPRGIVSEYVQTGLDTNYDIKVDIYPPPSEDQTLYFNVYVPQADMAADATITRVPQNVLIEEVVARMRVARGVEGAPQAAPGETFIMTNLLARAIADDQSADGTETDWVAE